MTSDITHNFDFPEGYEYTIKNNPLDYAKKVEKTVITTEKKLDEYAEFKAQKTLLDLDKQKLIDTVYTPEIKKAVSDIEAEFTDKSKAVSDKISALNDAIVAEAVTMKSSAHGKFFMVVYNPGGSSVSASDVEKLALTYDKVNQKLAAEIRSILKPKKASASVQANRKGE